MMLHSENEARIHATSNMKDDFFMKFESRFWTKTYHFMANLGGNTIEHVSEMTLYIILSTLEKNLQ